MAPWIAIVVLLIVLSIVKRFGLGENTTVLTSPQSAVVVDGDTIIVNGTRVRLYAIDAPEGKQQCKDAAGSLYACGEVSTTALRDMVRGKAVRCDGHGSDEYERVVAICYADGIDLNAELVESGMAVAYRDISSLYVPNEERAKQNRRGMWAGSFQMPWDYRRDLRRNTRPGISLN